MTGRIRTVTVLVWSACILLYGAASFGERTGSGFQGGASGGQQGSSSPVKDPDQLQNYPVVPKFKENFDKCTAKANMGNDCKFEDLGIIGDKAHAVRPSCHNAGEAIDVGFIECAGQKIQPNDPKYLEFVKCFADDTNGEMNNIFHIKAGQNTIPKSDHVKHVHIQLKNCRMVTAAAAGGVKGG